MKLFLTLMGLILALATPATALAHTTPDSQVTLRVESERVVADVIIPANEYSFATGQPSSNTKASLDWARSYLMGRVELRTADGRVWRESLRELAFKTVEGPKDLRATIVFMPPPNAATERFSLNWTPVLTETADHFATILVADPDGFDDAQLVGLLRQGNTAIDIEARQSSAPAKFAGAIRLGVAHILGGLDHLAFLLALLLAAPMVAEEGRWKRLRDKRATIKALVILATGFTIGHSLTLIGVAASGLTLPGSVVEPAIAATVLITAIHAIRPLFAGKELLVATVFGLVHGLGFAGFIQETDAQAASSIITLLGFNLGIEIVQIALVAVFVPLVFWLQRLGLYSRLRVALAIVVSVAAIYWMVSRIVILPF